MNYNTIQLILAFTIALLAFSILISLYLKYNHFAFNVNKLYIKLRVMNGYIANPLKIEIEDNSAISTEHVFVYMNTTVLIINPNVDITEIILFPLVMITKRDNKIVSKSDICRIKVKESYYYVDAYQFCKSFKLQYLNTSYGINLND